MLAIKIDNPEIENQFSKYLKDKKQNVEDIVAEAIKYFIESKEKEDKLIYTKKNPINHLHKIEYKDDDENLDDVAPYSHVEESALYIHNLRREKS